MGIIDFQSNQTAQGTSGNDTMVGQDSAGNNNDLVYGHQGNDIAEFDASLNNSTLYGGQDNDTLEANNGSALYGNFGDDVMEVFGNATTMVVSFGDAFYGGQGNDIEVTSFSSSDVLYGNLGNDLLSLEEDASSQVAYGGQGQDSVEQVFSGSAGALYGNQGNDLVEDFRGSGFLSAENNSFAAAGTSVLYGGQGDDTLTAPLAGGDTMLGGLGHNLYVGNSSLGGSSFSANDLLTVEGFVSGSDSLSLSTDVSAQTFAVFEDGFLTKEDDAPVANARDAMSAANAFYAADSDPGYLFIYGGSGAGYLFYNGDGGGSAVNDGMILVGDNAEGSLQAGDVVASSFAQAP